MDIRFPLYHYVAGSKGIISAGFIIQGNDRHPQQVCSAKVR